MVTKVTPSGRFPTSPITSLAEVLDVLQRRLHEAVQQFRQTPVTPRSFLALENELAALTQQACGQVLELEANRAESDDPRAVPQRIRYHKEMYRRNKKTPAQVATRFGMMTLWSFYYLNDCDGEPGLHPLWVRLGIADGAATPALLERVARQSVDHTQAEVRAWLLREHGLKWSNDRLRSALRGFRQALLPFVAELQKQQLLTWLYQAEQSRGRHRPVLAAGRDGIMTPMRCGGYQEASTATVSVYDRRRRRLGTVYLGQMPQAKQTALSTALTALLKATLAAWQGALPRLAYVTDKGSAPDEYYHQVLKKMKHPREGQLLAWEWVLDFYHVCTYIGDMADALFGPNTQAGAQWFAKMRHWLKERPQGVAQVLRSAMQLLERRRMTKAQKTDYGKAYRYLRRHRRWMDYAGYRRRGLPLGSGVTEAACKTVFTQRFKRSGMRWQADSGQVVLDLRVIQLSGIWEKAFDRDLNTRAVPEPIPPNVTESQRRSQRTRAGATRRFAA